MRRRHLWEKTGRSLFIVQAPLTVGRFIARFGVVDAQGQRGSLQHTFDDPGVANGSVRLSDIILGTGRANAFGPAARISASVPLTARLVVRDSTRNSTTFGAGYCHARDRRRAD